MTVREEFKAGNGGCHSLLAEIAQGHLAVTGVTREVKKPQIPSLLHLWGSMYGLPDAFSFYERMSQCAERFNRYIDTHYRLYGRSYSSLRTPPLVGMGR